MPGSLYVVLILLETVLHGTISVTDTDPTMPSTSFLFESTFNTPESTTYSTSSVTTVSSEDTSTETSPTSSSGEGSSGGTQEGLTPAEAAGVAVGTIAGVAALGGGIYAGLKFSGKLG